MKTIIDPKEARHFAQFLEERAKDIKALDSKTYRMLLDLKLSHWQDGRYQQFEKRYEEASNLVQAFLDHSQKYADYLRKKAVPIERYLGRRY